MDELACRCAKFSCLYSESDVVKSVARHGIYFRKMLSPGGRNSLFCCSRFGVHLSDIVSRSCQLIIIRSLVHHSAELYICFLNY